MPKSPVLVAAVALGLSVAVPTALPVRAQAPAAPVKKDEAKKNEVRRDAAPGQTQKRN